jgi:hypothetical protein
MADGHFIRVIRRREVLALAFGAMIRSFPVESPSSWSA